MKTAKYIFWFMCSMGGAVLVAGVAAYVYILLFHTDAVIGVGLVPFILLTLLYICVLAVVAISICVAGECIRDYLYRHGGRWLPRRTINFK